MLLTVSLLASVYNIFLLFLQCLTMALFVNKRLPIPLPSTFYNAIFLFIIGTLTAINLSASNQAY